MSSTLPQDCHFSARSGAIHHRLTRILRATLHFVLSWSRPEHISRDRPPAGRRQRTARPPSSLGFKSPARPALCRAGARSRSRNGSRSGAVSGKSSFAHGTAFLPCPSRPEALHGPHSLDFELPRAATRQGRGLHPDVLCSRDNSPPSPGPAQEAHGPYSLTPGTISLPSGTCQAIEVPFCGPSNEVQGSPRGPSPGTHLRSSCHLQPQRPSAPRSLSCNTTCDA